MGLNTKVHFMNRYKLKDAQRVGKNSLRKSCSHVPRKVTAEIKKKT